MTAFISQDLATVPADHALRNMRLIDIGAEYRWRNGKSWRKVLPSFAIANKSFNHLGSAWTDHDQWRATISLQSLYVLAPLTRSHPTTTMLGHDVAAIHQPCDHMLGYTRLDLKANDDKSVLVLFGQMVHAELIPQLRIV